MTRQLYDQLAAMMAPHLVKPLRRLYSTTGTVPAVSAAIYVGLMADRSVDYVGSVSRSGDATALASRLHEHGASRRWRYVVVFPLDPSTPIALVRTFEGAVGRITRPVRNQRLPSASVLVGVVARRTRRVAHPKAKASVS